MKFIISFYFLILVFTILYFLAACGSAESAAPLPQPVVDVEKFTTTPLPTIPPTATPVPSPTFTPQWTSTPTLPLTATKDPYLDYYVESLMERKYGGGVLEDLGNLQSSGYFTRRLFKYRSEGLNLFGFVNIPEGEGPFPVIIMLHGYVNPGEYMTIAYSARYADALVEVGYIVVHPNLRGYALSEDGENSLGIGDTVDTMNLIQLIRGQSGTTGILEKADTTRIGLWGHSMSGGIVMRAMVIDPDIKAGLLYASIHPNEEFNLAHFEEDGRGRQKIDAPPGALQNISVLDYLNRINRPISIHHGRADAVVPLSWSEFLCKTLEEVGGWVECKFYPDQPHTFKNAGDRLFIQNMISFFDRTVK